MTKVHSWTIESIDIPKSIFICASEKSQTVIHFHELDNGYVLDENPHSSLEDELSSDMTPSKRCLDDLRRLNFNTSNIQRKEDSCTILEICNSDFSRSPTSDEIDSYYYVLKINELYKLGYKYFTRLREFMEPTEGPFDPDIRWRLAYFARHAGRLEEAIRITDVIELQKPLFMPRNGQRSVICTIRAATYLDLYEMHNDCKYLKPARIYAGMGWAASQGSDELSMVYQRLKAFELHCARIKREKMFKEKLSEIGDPNNLEIRKPHKP